MFWHILRTLGEAALFVGSAGLVAGGFLFSLGFLILGPWWPLLITVPALICGVACQRYL